MSKRRLKLALAWSVASSFLPLSRAHANTLELSVGFSYSQSTFSPGSYQWSRRWGASIGYYLWSISEIELGFQDVYDRTRIEGAQDTTFNDRIYSVNWVQGLTPKGFPVQPYLKVGAGQLNRDASGTYASGATVPSRLDSLTVIAGAGLKILILRTFGLRVEANTYLIGGVLSTWKDNFAFTSGVSLYF